MNCPNCCSGNVKDNGYGFFRCRDCDIEWKITFNEKCVHKWELHKHCVKCGKEVDDKNENIQYN
jgi:hypothetical protein